MLKKISVSTVYMSTLKKRLLAYDGIMKKLDEDIQNAHEANNLGEIIFLGDALDDEGTNAVF